MTQEDNQKYSEISDAPAPPPPLPPKPETSSEGRLDEPPQYDLQENKPTIGGSVKRNFIIFAGVMLLLIFLFFFLFGDKDKKAVPPDPIPTANTLKPKPEDAQKRTPSRTANRPTLGGSTSNNTQNNANGTQANTITPPPIPQPPQPISSSQLVTPQPPALGASSSGFANRDSDARRPSFASRDNTTRSSNRRTPFSFRSRSQEDTRADTFNRQDEDYDARIRANPIIFGSGTGGSESAISKVSGDPNIEFVDAVIDPLEGVPNSSAATQGATKYGNPYNIILQGKMIDAVLETGINTDLPGSLRAVVSRDVYAEAGRKVLIPRGSRLIGSYRTEVQRGRARVFIIWNRVIRPDRIDIELGSSATDLLGRSGVFGKIDNKYMQLFTNSILLTAINLGAAAAGGALSAGDISTSDSNGGNVRDSGNIGDLATLSALKDFSSTIKQIAGDFINVNPTITINQGTPIKIYVNKDLHFPADTDQKVTIIR